MPDSYNRPVGVVLMTMGDASTTAGVLPFLVRLFSDPAIIRAPWFVRYPLSLYIAIKKLPKMLSRYKAIGGGSPMNAITSRQAEALQARLSGFGNFRVYVANRYCSPDTRDAYRRMKSEGIKTVVALPLFPQYSTATTGSSFMALERLIKDDKDPPDVIWLRGFADEPCYVRAFSRKLLEAIAEFPEDERTDVQVLFSAHSLPHEFIKDGDPYLDEIRKSLTGVLRIVKPACFHLCFQSKGGGRREWLKPETDEVLAKLAEKGRTKAVIAPVSFVAENIETLYDADIYYREMAARLGFKGFVRVKCIDDDPEFIEGLAGMVVGSL